MWASPSPRLTPMLGTLLPESQPVELCDFVNLPLTQDSPLDVRQDTMRSRLHSGKHVIIQSPQARKPLDRMCVHAGDGQTYLVRVDSMS